MEFNKAVLNLLTNLEITDIFTTGKFPFQELGICYVSLFNQAYIFFSSVAFYSFIQKYSVIKFAKLTLDAFDCINRVKPFSPILNIYVIFFLISWEYLGNLWMENRRIKGGVIHSVKKKSQLFHSS